jgi:hypothetical protein
MPPSQPYLLLLLPVFLAAPSSADVPRASVDGLIVRTHTLVSLPETEARFLQNKRAPATGPGRYEAFTEYRLMDARRVRD